MTATTPASVPRLGDTGVAAVAARLWDAEQRATAIEPLTAAPGGFEPADAYPVQLAVADIRRGLGHRVVGKKIGLTSKAMQDMAGVAEPDYGHLFDTMWIPDGGSFRRADLVHPKVEPELAFVLAADLRGPVTPAAVLAATAFVTPALEIVDSRIADWRVRWADTVADNGSSSRFVLAERGFSPLGLDLRATEVTLRRGGEVVGAAAMSEVLGSPLRAICWLAQKLDDYGIGLHAGDVVLPGSPCRAIDAHAGDEFVAEFTGMGSVGVTVD
ncbi:MAG: 2-keto-4-pentenoate hydratase [Mycobacterium sp.]|nr:2-keto-4-pentenoate hydratase [Mycobacterium sp.]